jgi:TonB family protein
MHDEKKIRAARKSQRRAALKAAVVLSLAVHAAALAGIHRVFPNLIWAVPAETYHLELIRPEVEDLDESGERHEEARLNEDPPEPPPPPEQPAEDTISLNTRDQRYADYAGIVKKRLLEHWTYPPEAKALLIEGRLLLMFTLSRDGRTRSIDILDPSGRDLLDEEARRAVRSASPFPPFPEHITLERLNIRAVFDYRLTSN